MAADSQMKLFQMKSDCKLKFAFNMMVFWKAHKKIGAIFNLI